MIKRALVVVLLGALTGYAYLPAHAAHPLITDDTGTQGKGKFQFELNAAYGMDRESAAGITVESRELEFEAVLAFGIADPVDVFVAAPYARVRETAGGVTSKENGPLDAAVGLKWRFYENAAGLSLGVKPAVILPTGDEEKGLGAGKTGYELFFVATQEAEPWAFHLNLGYLRNNNDFDERKDLYHASLATEHKIGSIRLAGNVGIERNSDKTADDDPAFGIVGIIYGIRENLDIDAGYKIGLTKSETDGTLLAGLAYRF
ncbi:MAG: transporter [Nitrospirota bacterium]|nr:transporter [Nitrospirota bacterium]